MVLTILSSMGIRLNFEETLAFIFALGDDNLIGLDQEIRDQYNFLKAFAHRAMTIFGMSLNLKKTRVTQHQNDIEVLGYRNKNGIPHRDLERLVAACVCPERFQTPAKLKARALGFAHAANGQSAQFHDAMKSLYLRFKDADLWTHHSDVLRQLETLGPVKDEFPSRAELQERCVNPVPPDPCPNSFWPKNWFIEGYNFMSRE